MNTYRITYRFMSAGLSETTKEAATEKRALHLLFDQLGSRHITIVSVEQVES